MFTYPRKDILPLHYQEPPIYSESIPAYLDLYKISLSFNSVNSRGVGIYLGRYCRPAPENKYILFLHRKLLRGEVPTLMWCWGINTHYAPHQISDKRNMVPASWLSSAVCRVHAPGPVQSLGTIGQTWGTHRPV